MNKNNCVFCERLKDRDIVVENNYFFAVTDAYPVTSGHILIIPKRHILNIEDLNIDENTSLITFLMVVIDKIKTIDFRKYYENKLKNISDERQINFLKKVLSSKFVDEKIKDYNIGINNGTLAGRTINHLHVHIIPRFKGDVKDCIGGIRNIIPGNGNYKK